MGPVKVKAVGMKGECEWDHKGRTQIVQIIKSYSYGPIVIGSLQFQYLEKNGHVHTSEIIGSPNFDRPYLDSIIFQGSHEHITKVEGNSRFVSHRSCLVEHIRRLTIHTNEKVYKIFDDATSFPDNFRFEFGGENQFGGFHGTYSSSGLTSIGVYFNHLTALPATYSHFSVKTEDEDLADDQVIS